MRKIAFIIIIIIATFLSLPFIMAQTGAALSIFPEEAAIGEPFDVLIWGLEPGAEYELQVVFAEDEQELYRTSFTADAEGSYQIGLVSDESDPKGTSLIRVLDAGEVIAEGRVKLLDRLFEPTVMPSPIEAMATALAATGTPTPVDGPSSSVNIMIRPESAPQGTVQRVNVSGLTPNETVRLEVLNTGTQVLVYIKNWKTDTSGRLQVDLFSNENNPPGLHKVTIYDAGGVKLAEANYTVEPRIAATGELTISPAAGERGTSHSLMITGVKPFEKLYITVRNDETGQVKYEDTIRATVDGEADITLVTDDIYEDGAYTVAVSVDRNVIIERRLMVGEMVPPEDVSLRILPEQGPIGTNHLIQIEGLYADEMVSIQVNYDGEHVYSVERNADAKGQYEMTLVSEAGDPIGVYTVQVFQMSETPVAEANFEVTEATVQEEVFTAPVMIEVMPAIAPQGSDYTVEISGLESNQRVDIEVSFAGEMVYNVSKTAESNGTIVMTLSTSADDAVGEYRLIVSAEGRPLGRTTFRVGDDVALQGPETDGPGPNDKVKLTISPQVGAVDAYVIGISGLQPNQETQIHVFFNDTYVDYQALQADASGLIETVFERQVEDVPGLYLVYVSVDGKIVKRSEFIITPQAIVETPEMNPTEISPTESVPSLTPAAQTGVYSLTIEPESVMRGTGFLIRVEGLKAGERYTLEISHDIEGDVFVKELQADEAGLILLDLVSEASDTPGIYTVSILAGDKVLVDGQFEIVDESVDKTDNEAQVEQTAEPMMVTVEVLPDQAVAGSSHRIDVSGLSPETDYTVDIKLGIETVYTASITTDEEGRAFLHIKSNESDLKGRYDVLVTAGAGDDRMLMGEGSFVIKQAPDPTPPVISIAPVEASRGSSHEIVVTGLEAGETLNVSIRFAGEIVYEAERTANDAGEVRMSIATEASDAVGVYTVTATRANGLTASTELSVIE